MDYTGRSTPPASLSIVVAHDEYPAGTVVDAERPLTHCRASIRCS